MMPGAPGIIGRIAYSLETGDGKAARIWFRYL
jgi:hypothetical protein